MLSRKTSNMIFYVSIAAILALILVIRFLSIGTLNGQITSLTNQNRSLRTQIEQLEQEVQDNKDIASNHLYELYDQVPETYNYSVLSKYTQAQMELVGILREDGVEPVIDITDDPDDVTFPVDSVFTELQQQFRIVKVQVSFNVKIEDVPAEEESQQLQVVDDFIEQLYGSEQVFIVNFIQYQTPDDDDFVQVQVNFLAFYKLEETNS